MREGQTKRDSLLEATINIMIGYGVAIAAQKVIFPVFGIQVSTADDCKIAGLFTIVSLIRSYVLRRLFNWWHVYKLRRDVFLAVKNGNLTINDARGALVESAYLNAGVATVDEVRERMGLDHIFNH